MSSLKDRQLQLLTEVLAKRRPDLVALAERTPLEDLTKDQLWDIEMAISSEFCATGLREDDEPNERGLLLNSLLTVVNRVYIEKREQEARRRGDSGWRPGRQELSP